MAAKKRLQSPVRRVMEEGVKRAGRAVRNKAVDMAMDAEMLMKHPKDTLIEWGGQIADEYYAPRGRMAPPTRRPAPKPKPAPKKKR